MWNNIKFESMKTAVKKKCFYSDYQIAQVYIVCGFNNCFPVWMKWNFLYRQSINCGRSRNQRKGCDILRV